MTESKPVRQSPQEIRKTAELDNAQAWSAYTKLTFAEAVYYCSGLTPETISLSKKYDYPDRVGRIRQALINQIISGSMQVSSSDVQVQECLSEGRKPNWAKVYLDKQVLDDWLGTHTEVAESHKLSRLARFAPFLDSSSEHYSEKLFATLDAVAYLREYPDALKNTTPKQAIIAYLKKNYPQIGTEARESIATTANWKPKGGAPKIS